MHHSTLGGKVGRGEREGGDKMVSIEREGRVGIAQIKKRGEGNARKHLCATNAIPTTISPRNTPKRKAKCAPSLNDRAKALVMTASRGWN